MAEQRPTIADMPTELAIGSDGEIYVNEESFAPKEIEGRKRFVGYAMTPEEKMLAVDEIHRMAPNITIAARLTAKKPAAKGKRRKSE